MTQPITIDRHLRADRADDARADIRRTFVNTPKVLRPKWLYDDRGSELFDQITRLAEYYPTEAERSILNDRAAEIVERSGATTVIELGSGTSDKTRTLLDAFWATGQLERFVPLDVSDQTLVDAAAMLAERYDGLAVHAVVGDFTEHLSHLPKDGHRLVAFLGGTLGNFYVEERRAFLGAMADTLDAGEWLLLGVDLVKNSQRILDAYNDPTLVSQAFIVNALHALNDQFEANLPVDQFDYVPFWDGHEERMDLRLRASVPIEAHIGALDLDVAFSEGEELRVEISTKFREDRLGAELADAGFEIAEFWRSEAGDDGRLLDGDFGLVLARRV